MRRAVAALMALAGAVALAAPARADQVYPALGELAGCVKEHRALDVLMLFDSSGSLYRTDPGERRFAAAQVALAQLNGIAEANGDGRPVTVRVGIAQFAGEYRQTHGWRTLRGSPDEVQADIATVRSTRLLDRTDYALALSGAQRTLAGSPTACKALLWFTDGKYEPLPDNAGVAAQEDAAEEGLAELCAPNGVVDQLRADDVKTVVVGLASELDPGDQQRLRRLAGEDGECGSRPVAGSHPGIYLAARDDDDLIYAFADFAAAITDGTRGAECATNGCSFDLQPPLNGFGVLIHTAEPGDVTLQPPRSAPVVLARAGGSTARVGASRITWAWTTSDLVWVTGSLDRADVATWRGVWTVRFPGGRGTGRVYLTTGLTPEIAEPPQAFDLDRPWTLRLRIGGADGDLLRAVDRLGPTMSVTFSDPRGQEASLRVDAVRGADPGTFTATAQPPATWAAQHVRVEASLTVPMAGGTTLHPPPLIAEFAVHGAIGVEPSVLKLPDLVGDGSTEAPITVRAYGQEACVWVDGARGEVPNPVGPVALTTSGLGTDEAGCTRLAPGGTGTLTVRLDARDARWTGPLSGTLFVNVRTADAPARRVAVPLETHQDRGRTPPRVYAVAAALAAGGCLLPLAVLWLVNWLVLARFDRRELRVALARVDADLAGAPSDWTGEPLTTAPRRLWLGRTTVFRIRLPWRTFVGRPVAVWAGGPGGAGRTLPWAGNDHSRPVDPDRLEVPLVPMVLVRPAPGSVALPSPRPAADDRQDEPAKPAVPAEEPVAFDPNKPDWFSTMRAAAAAATPEPAVVTSTTVRADATPPAAPDPVVRVFDVAVLSDFTGSVLATDVRRLVSELVTELINADRRSTHNRT